MPAFLLLPYSLSEMPSARRSLAVRTRPSEMAPVSVMVTGHILTLCLSPLSPPGVGAFGKA